MNQLLHYCTYCNCTSLFTGIVMSKARLSRDRRAAPVGISRVTRSSMMSPQDCERSRAPDSRLLDELSLMSVSEKQASAARSDKHSDITTHLCNIVMKCSLKRSDLVIIPHLINCQGLVMKFICSYF